ncbi:MAG: hypothetical protein V3V26_02410, partial [Candidatus Aenigmarchaeota archaeon]
NLASAYTYSLNLGPSICFPRYRSDNPFDVEPCVTIGENGEEVLSPNQPWYEAFTFLAEETPEDSSILSWWDFGYWFQTRGQRPSVSDGGGAGPRYDIAIWFMNDAKNWSDDACDFNLKEHYTCEAWLRERYHVDYIIMDYTLPGKYGAISKIGSEGKQIIGMLQFQQTGLYPQGNKTVYEFKSGPYSIWLPFEGPGLSGTPMFLVSQGDQYVSRAYINDVCTTSGIIKAGTETPDIGGCVAITNFGVFYIPQEAYKNVFTSLMFMDGYGFPVEKVFDNGAIRIYKLLYEGEEAETAEEPTPEDFLNLTSFGQLL